MKIKFCCLLLLLSFSTMLFCTETEKTPQYIPEVHTSMSYFEIGVGPLPIPIPVFGLGYR